jgi:predicted Zn-dependent peptidase
MKYDEYQLSNGIRLIHSKVPNLIAHLGLIMNTGSRDEKETEHGLAHLVEHLVFKGTPKRKPYHIISRLEDVGGEINAYTTKEETCIYASFMKQDYSRALELIEDICFHSVFPLKEINKEKDVIIDEINSYLDSPGELIFDDFEDLVYRNHPIGRNILGTAESLEKVGVGAVKNFFNQNYFTDEMVLCSVGNISFERLKSQVEKYFGNISLKTRSDRRKMVGNYTPTHQTFTKNTHQGHCIIGNIAYDLNDARRIGLHLLNNIIGGPGLNSRLNMTLREKNGYSYHTESNYSPYSDTGIISIYFSGDKSKIERSKKTVQREFNKLCDKRLGSLQLSKAKRQLLGQIAISAENNETQMLSMAKSYLVYNKADSLEEISAKIEAITTEEIQEIAREVLDKNRLSSLTYK